jgi:methylenetetrahydrofolate reductase (NADPH)
MLADLDGIADNADLVAQYGIDWSTRQCRELLAAKVDGLHFYTLNKSKATRQIVQNLRHDGALP